LSASSCASRLTDGRKALKPCQRYGLWSLRLCPPGRDLFMPMPFLAAMRSDLSVCQQRACLPAARAAFFKASRSGSGEVREELPDCPPSPSFARFLLHSAILPHAVLLRWSKRPHLRPRRVPNLAPTMPRSPSDVGCLPTLWSSRRRAAFVSSPSRPLAPRFYF
jgi:hypothetical protein